MTTAKRRRHFPLLLVVLQGSLLCKVAAATNVLFLMTDQQRFDAIRRVQDEIAEYDGKLKVNTPNLDRLSQEGVYFKNAYSHCPVCGPARTVLRTGCTIERTGVQTNSLVDGDSPHMENVFSEKIEELRSVDQILVEQYGYENEYMGKWHIPPRLFYDPINGTTRVIRHNDYDWATEEPTFKTDGYMRTLRRYLNHHNPNEGFQMGDQEDTYTYFPYEPIQLDSRYGYPERTNLYTNQFNSHEQSQNSVKGRYRVDEYHTSSYVNAKMGLLSMQRLAAAQNNSTQPWMLTISFHSPHPPMMAIDKYLDYYWNDRDQIFVSPNHHDPMDNSGYVRQDELNYLEEKGYLEPAAIQEWTALYYALVEEIDVLVGELLDELDNLGLTNDTMVIFTSDHGEMLGSHRGLRGKGKFYEEAVRVPLFIKLPGQITPGQVVEDSVSHLDIFSTILDYAGAADADQSDGKSLRRFMDGDDTHPYTFNDEYDESVVVLEWDYRSPESNNSLSRDLDSAPAFCLLHKGWKLMMYKKATSPKLDMLFHVAADRYEQQNLIGIHGNDTASADDAIIGKTEHLRALLLEWMHRMDGGDDGNKQYYSHPKSNANEGLGDIMEIGLRQPWRRLDLWVSELDTLWFGKTSYDGNSYVRHEYLYVGRRTPGSVTLESIHVEGKDELFFSLELLSPYSNDEPSSMTIQEHEHVRIKVSFSSTILPPKVKAKLVLKSTAGPDIKIDLSLTVGGSASPPLAPHPPLTPWPTPQPVPTAPTLPSIPFIQPPRECSPTNRCGRCEGHCKSDDECELDLVCHDKDAGGDPIPGCKGTDNSMTEWCIPIEYSGRTRAPSPPTPPPEAVDPIPFVLPPRPCSSTDPCQRCQGHCEGDNECVGDLICHDKEAGGSPIPGCIGTDMSKTEWCIAPPLPPSPPVASLPPTFAPTLVDGAFILTASEAMSCTLKTENAGFKGSMGYCDFDGKEDWIEWENVEVPATGTYEARMRYSSASSRPLELLIDSAPAGTYNVPETGLWTVWDTETLTVTLTQGMQHTIRLHAAESKGPNVDQVTFVPVV